MSTNVIYNGITYTIPAVNEVGWGQNVTRYLIALSNGSLTLAGGPFTITSDVNFGSAFGLITKYVTSVSALPALTGSIRLANLDTINFRNGANTGDITLGISPTNQLLFNGVTLPTTVSPTITGTLTVTGNENVSGNGTFGGTLGVTGAVTAGNFIGPGTGLTGTATALNIGGNAATATLATTVTTNANLTGPVTSVGNATTIAPTGATPGSYGTGVLVPQITVSADGRITSVSNISITTSGMGTVTHNFQANLTPNAVVLGNNSGDIITMGGLGTTTQVLHGNASGAPSWGALNLATDVTGNLNATHLNSGTNASVNTYWRGDGTWATAGINNVLNLGFINGGYQMANGQIPSIVTIGITASVSTGGGALLLPPANTLRPQGPIYIVRNTYFQPLAVRDFVGNLIAVCSGGGEIELTLENNSTTAGVWSYTGKALEAGIVIGDSNSTIGALTASGQYNVFCVMQPGVAIGFTTAGAGLIQAFVMDGTTGNPQAFYGNISLNGLAGVPAHVIQISSTQCLAFWGASSTTHYCAVLTLNGSPGAYSISVGTVASFVAAMLQTSWDTSTQGPYTTQPKTQIVMLTPTNFAAVWVTSAGTSINGVPITVSGTTVTIGAVATINATTTTVAGGISLYPITATTAFMIYNNSTTAYWGNVITCSGGLIGGNTAAAIGTSTVCSGGALAPVCDMPPSCLTSTPGQILVVEDSGGAVAINAKVITVGTTTFTVGTPTNLVTSGGQIPQTSGYNSISTTSAYVRNTNPHLSLQQGGNIFFWYVTTVGSTAMQLQITGTSVFVAGTIQQNTISKGSTTYNTLGYGFMGPCTTAAGGGGNYVVLQNSSTVALATQQQAIYVKSYPQNLSAPTTAGATFLGNFNQTTLYGMSANANGQYVITNNSLTGAINSITVFNAGGSLPGIGNVSTIQAPPMGMNAFIGNQPMQPIFISPTKFVITGSNSYDSAQTSPLAVTPRYLMVELTLN